jgi:threonine synthase
MYEKKAIQFLSKTSSPVWKKYLPVLPIDNFAVHFDEQQTPLIPIPTIGKKYGFGSIFVKDESKNPSGSFKDKESSIIINAAREQRINKVYTVSSGNAAVSTAAYASRAGIPCECLVSSHLSVGKRFLIGLYGGKIIENKGNYEEIYRDAIDSNYSGWNVTPGINPLKDEGIKIIGFEIFEQMGVPDTIVVPCGNGTLLYGIYKAFKELQYFGYTDRLPKMIGVQMAGAAPLKKSFELKKDYVVLKDIPDSIAEGIIAEESFSSPKTMLALEDTGGEIIEVSDAELVVAMKDIIATEALLPEPTSASVYAALPKLTAKSDEKIVLIQSAGGMKNLKEIMGQLVRVSREELSIYE